MADWDDRRSPPSKELLPPRLWSLRTGLEAVGSAATVRSPHSAISQVAALVARLQLTIQVQFHTQTLSAHTRSRLRASNLIAPAREGKRVVIADDALLDVTQDCGQLQLRGQGAMVIGEVLDRPREPHVPFRPVFFL